MASTTPLPSDHRLEPTSDLRRLSAGRILVGGAPLTIVRLSEAGTKAVDSWFAGEPVGQDPSHQHLARRLLANGMAHPILGQRTKQPLPALTVIIPVRNDSAGLEQTLASLDGNMAAVVVGDDGSDVPVSIPSAAGVSNLAIIRNEVALGPGRARQQGLAKVKTQTVLFIDAGVEIKPAGLDHLLRHLEDETLVAVAPRIVSPPESHLVGRYEQRRSALDLGPTPSLVGPGRAVPYVPTACLAAQANALEQCGGFDPDLRYGEDVDLVWRLGKLGDVRYVAEVEARHPPRSTIVALMTQRWSYGTAATPLAERHDDAVSPARLSSWSVAVASLLIAGHPLAAAALAVGTARALQPKIAPMPAVSVEAALLAGRGHWYGGLSMLTALARTWIPLAGLAALLFPSQRRRIGLTVGAAFTRRVLDGPRQPGPAAVDLALGVVDDLSYCAGVWQGSLRARSIKALKPRFVSWPGPSRPDLHSRSDPKS